MTPRAVAFLILCIAAASSWGAQERDSCRGGIHDCPGNFYPNPTHPRTEEGRAKLQAAHLAFASAKIAAEAERQARLDREAKATKLREKLAIAFPKVDTQDVIDAREAYAQANRYLREAQERFAPKAEAAITAAIEAYGLRPMLTQLPETDPLRSGMRAWSPRFSREEVRDAVTRQWRQRTKDELDAEEAANKARAAKLGLPEDEAGVLGALTDIRGEIRIFSDVFSQGSSDSASLALLIFHETVHWVDVTATPRTSLRPAEKFRLEQNAYAREAAFTELLRGPGAGASRARESAQYGKQAAEAESRYMVWRDVPDSWLQGTVPAELESSLWDRPQPEPLRLEGERFAQDLGGIQSSAGGLREAAEAAFVDRQRARQEAQRAQDERLRALRRAREEAEEASWDYLIAMTKLACSDPSALNQQVETGKVVGADLGSLDMMRLRDRIQTASGWGSVGKHLSACQDALIGRMIANRGPAAVYKLIEWADQYRAAHPSLGERVGNALDEFFNALTRVAPAPPGPGSPETPPSNETQTPPREPREPRERTQTDDRERSGIYVPPCLQEEGRRCIRW